MPQPITSNATLHALTERLATHSRALSPFNFPTGDRLAAYRQPAPPPLLPVLQLSSRHQEVPQAQPVENGVQPDANGVVKCPAGNRYPPFGQHSDKRCSKCEEEELDGFVDDMGWVLRREFDAWVEQCWSVLKAQVGCIVLTLQGRSISSSLHKDVTHIGHTSHSYRLITPLSPATDSPRRFEPRSHVSDSDTGHDVH